MDADAQDRIKDELAKIRAALESITEQLREDFGPAVVAAKDSVSKAVEHLKEAVNKDDAK